MPPYTARPRCSMNDPKTFRWSCATRRDESTTIRLNLAVSGDGQARFPSHASAAMQAPVAIVPFRKYLLESPFKVTSFSLTASFEIMIKRSEEHTSELQ